MSEFVEKLIESISPRWALSRLQVREEIENSRAMSAAYRHGVYTRLDSSTVTSGSLFGAMHPLNRATLTVLRDKARDLDRNNTLAASSLDRAVENVVGVGPVLQARTSDDGFNKIVEKRWAWWKYQADIRELCSFDEILRLVYRGVLRDGDAGIVLVDRGGFPRIQCIEGDLIESPTQYDAERRWVDGVRWTRLGAPREFSIKTVEMDGRTTYTTIGASSFIFVMRMTRTSDLRGEPVFAKTLGLYDHLDGYVDGVIQAMRSGACQALFITTDKPASRMRLEAQHDTAIDSTGAAVKKWALQPLTVRVLNPGESVTAFTPQQPGQQFESSINTLCRMLGVNLGLSLEQVLLNFEKVSYLSSRAMRQQADAIANVERSRIETKILRRIYRWWIDKMAAAGEIPQGPDDRMAHEWIYEPRGWIDPDKDLKAALLELNMGLTTLEILAKERGREFAELVQKREQELKTLKEAGIPVVLSASTRGPDQLDGYNEADPKDEEGN